MIVINDGSTDDTVQKALRAGAIVVSHKVQQGVGSAVRNGYLHALKRADPEDIIINLDGDGQHRPQDIPRLLQPIQDGNADLVIGSRFLHRSKKKWYPIVRTLGNHFFSLFISILIRVKITDAQSGFRAIKAKYISRFDMRCKFTNRQEMIMQAYHLGLQIAEIPIDVEYRKFGVSFLGTIKNKLRFFFTVFRVILRTYFYPPI